MYNTLSKSIYCLYCVAGRECKAIQALILLGYDAFIPLQIKRIYNNGGVITREKPLILGYVFIEEEYSIEPKWTEIMRIPYVLKILEYSDGERALRGDDLVFMSWLKQINNKLDISNVVQVGSKIRVIDGPLKDYEGQIAVVKKHRKQVAIRVNMMDQDILVWCPIVYVNAV